MKSVFYGSIIASVIAVAFILSTDRTVSAVALKQTNPCTAPATLQINPGKINITSPEHTQLEIDGSPRVSDYQVAYFAEGANVNTATTLQGPITLAKTAFTLVSGTTDCYSATTPQVTVTGRRLIGAIKARRTGTAQIPAAESAWSTLSNPFGTAPVVLAPLGPGTMGQ